MGITIDGHHVSEASYAKAKANVEASTSKDTNAVLKELKQQFGEINFIIGNNNSSASASSGLNNVSIAPNILKEMAADPEKRIAYESLIGDIQNIWKNAYNRRLPGGGRTVYQEFFINSNGELGMMTISESGGSDSSRAAAMLPKDDKESWLELIMKSIEEKRKEEKAELRKQTEKDIREAGLENGGLTFDTKI